MPFDATRVPGWIEATYPLERVRVGQVLDRGKNVLVRVESATSSAWLRVAVGQRSALREAEDEARMLATLHERGLRVAPAIRLRGAVGEGFAAEFPDGPHTALLFAEAPGVAAAEPAPRASEALGALVAQIHRSPAPAVARRLDRAHLVDEPLHGVEPWLRKHGMDPRALRSTADAMIELASADGAWSDTVLCHGDLRLENARLEGELPTLFDFELWGVGPAVYDLACFWRKDIEGDGERARAEATWSAFVRGYRNIRPLDDGTLAAVPALAALRAIWTMAMPALPNARWGRDWLEDREYFEAHAEHIARYAAIARRQTRVGDAVPRAT